VEKNIIKGVKPYCYIGIMGHANHGKTTLTEAIIKVESLLNKEEAKQYEKSNNVLDEEYAESIKYILHDKHKMNKIHHTYIDHRADKNYIKNMISDMELMNTVILVVSADEGPVVQTREHILLARQMSICNIVVFINKADKVDDEQLIVAEEEIKSLLSEYDYYTDQDVIIIKGSALKALECKSTCSRALEYKSIKEVLKGINEFYINSPKQC